MLIIRVVVEFLIKSEKLRRVLFDFKYKVFNLLLYLEYYECGLCCLGNFFEFDRMGFCECL